MTESVETFAALRLSQPLLAALTEVGYETPSPIQAACIPHLLAGSDLLGEAQTGTGKTAAFALPLLERLDLANRNPQVLVLTPTRELAIQVAEAFQRYAKHLPGFHVLPLYGGQSMVVQLRALSRGTHVIVGTPGRVMDHLERTSLVLDNLKTLVLDEADEMLRMGFIDDVEWILEHTPQTWQTALFSATMPEPIRRVAHRHLREPQEVKIRSATTTVAAIRQRYWQVKGADKLKALTRILEVEDDFDAALIFVRTKTATVELAEKLEARGYGVAALNGDMTQGLREQVIDRLKSGSLDIVVATDVAARGIDVPRISHVVNYDVPYDTESYVHRIGRTGRAGRPGSAILFVAPREIRMLRAIERATRQPIEALTLPTRAAVADRRVAQFKQQVLDVIEAEKLDFFVDVVSQLEEEQDLSAQEIAAALAWMAQRERPLQVEGAERRNEAPAEVRETSQREFPHREFPSRDAPQREKPAYEKPAYAKPAYEKPAFEKPSYDKPSYDKPSYDKPAYDKPAFEKPAYEKPSREAAPYDKAPREHREEFAERPPRATVPGAMLRYRIDVGRNQGATPKDIVGAIANEGRIEGRQIGQIHLFDDYSTVELPNLGEDVLSILKRTRVRQVPLNIRALAAGEHEEKRDFKPRPKWEKDRPTPGKWNDGDKVAKRPYNPDAPAKPPYRSDSPAKAPYRSDAPAKAPYKGDAPYKSDAPAKAPFRKDSTLKVPFKGDKKPTFKTGGKTKPRFGR